MCHAKATERETGVSGEKEKAGERVPIAYHALSNLHNPLGLSYVRRSPLREETPYILYSPLFLFVFKAISRDVIMVFSVLFFFFN